MQAGSPHHKKSLQLHPAQLHPRLITQTVPAYEAEEHGGVGFGWAIRAVDVLHLDHAQVDLLLLNAEPVTLVVVKCFEEARAELVGLLVLPSDRKSTRL